MIIDPHGRHVKEGADLTGFRLPLLTLYDGNEGKVTGGSPNENSYQCAMPVATPTVWAPIPTVGESTQSLLSCFLNL